MYGLIFHANLQYAEIPKSEIERVIEKSYIPSIKKLVNHEIPFALNITGYSISLLPGDLIRNINEGIASDIIELTGTSYTHAILPLLELNRVERQIEKDLEIKREVFNCSPKTFWPPELAYDPILPAILRDFQYEKIFVDGEALLLSPHMNTAIKEMGVEYYRLVKAGHGINPYLNYFLGLPKLIKSLRYVFPGTVKLLGVKEITGIPVWQPVNIILMLGLGRFPLMNEKRAWRLLGKVKNVMLYGTDLEFFGYMPFGGKIMNIESLISFVKRNDIRIILPSKLPPSGREFYLKTSSWAPDKSLRIWREDEDNRRLNFLTHRMRGEKVELAENSDARGWEPIPERRLDAFKAIYEEWRENK